MVQKRRKQATKRSRGNVEPRGDYGLNGVTIAGFKSLYQPVSIAFGPLTLLAGANSSGKSSAMQPLLLLKQTLDAPYDPGGLLIDGPNVRFTSASQFLSRSPRGVATDTFRLSIRYDAEYEATLLYKNVRKRGVEPTEVLFSSKRSKPFALRRTPATSVDASDSA